MPQASCGGINVSGIDMLRLSSDAKSQDLILPLAVIVFALLAFALPNSILGVLGLLSHLGILISAKLDKEVGEMIKIEAGAFITALGFIVIILKQKIFQTFNNNINRSSEIKKENTGAKSKEELEEMENEKRRAFEKREESFAKAHDKKADEDFLKY
jgi:sulfite exporter TauE/SafE